MVALLGISIGDDFGNSSRRRICSSNSASFSCVFCYVSICCAPSPTPSVVPLSRAFMMSLLISCTISAFQTIIWNNDFDTMFRCVLKEFVDMMVIATHVVDDDALKQREMIYGIFHRPFEIITFFLLRDMTFRAERNNRATFQAQRRNFAP